PRHTTPAFPRSDPETEDLTVLPVVSVVAQPDHPDGLPVALGHQLVGCPGAFPPGLLVVLELHVPGGDEGSRRLAQRLQTQVTIGLPVRFPECPHVDVDHDPMIPHTRLRPTVRPARLC